MPGESGVTVVTMLVCFFILHARLRVHQAPGIPCSLYFRGVAVGKARAFSRRENAEVCVLVPFIADLVLSKALVIRKPSVKGR
jgi:hypothetical protein